MQNIPQQKEWSNATPAGLVALAIACFCFFALLTKQVDGSAIILVGCWLLGGFVIQFAVAILDLKNGNMAGGNTFLYFSAFFMLVGGSEMIVKAICLANKVAFDSRVDGWAWLVLSLVVILWTPAFFKIPSVLTLIVLALDFSVPFIALKDLKIISEYYSAFAGWGLLIAGILGIYLGSAMITNNAYGKVILPFNFKKG
jgi:succinate-acetate transporter protein